MASQTILVIFALAAVFLSLCPSSGEGYFIRSDKDPYRRQVESFLEFLNRRNRIMADMEKREELPVENTKVYIPEEKLPELGNTRRYENNENLILNALKQNNKTKREKDGEVVRLPATIVLLS